jgi:uncharacterized Tic20 family protein
MDITPPPVPSLTPSSDDKLWSALCHASLLFGVGFLLPLVVYLVKRGESPVVAENAREALNFHISVYLYAIVGWLLCFILIGILLLPILIIAAIVLSIVATIKSAEGKSYRYPMTIRLV